MLVGVFRWLYVYAASAEALVVYWSTALYAVMKLGTAPAAAVGLVICSLGTCSVRIVFTAVTWRLVHAWTMVLSAVVCLEGLTARLLLAALIVILMCRSLAVTVATWLALRLCRRLTLCSRSGACVYVVSVVTAGASLLIVCRPMLKLLKLLKLRLAMRRLLPLSCILVFRACRKLC